MAVAWLVLAALGQAATLVLTTAGSEALYQHFTPPWTFTGWVNGRADELLAPWNGVQIAALAVLICQIILVLWAFTRKIRTEWSFPGRWWQWALLAAFMWSVNAKVSRHIAGSMLEAGAVTLLQAVMLFNIALVVLSIPSDMMSRWTEAVGPRASGRGAGPGGINGIALASAAWVFLSAAFLAAFAYQYHPHVPDEVSYLLQAKYFAGGQLAMEIPPVVPAFDLDLMTYEATRWCSPFPPGWPAILTIGVLLGAPWLVNPVLGAVGVLLAFVLIRQLYDGRLASLVAVLMATSPWYVFSAMSLMSQTSALVLAIGATLATLKLRSSGRVRWVVPAGVCIGLVSISRPLEGLIVAGLLGLWLLVSDRATLSALTRLVRLGWLTLVTGATATLVLPYNWYLTGDPFYFPVMAYADATYGSGSNAMGFGPDQGFGWPGLDPLPGHGPIDVIINSNMNIFAMNVELHGWVVGSLMLIAFLIIWKRLRGPDWLMVTAILVTMLAHSFYWFSGGPDFGARYWYLILLPCVVLTARAIEELGTLLDNHGPSSRSRVVVGAMVLSLMALLTFFPWRATDKYYHYRRMDPGIRSLAKEHQFGRSLVFITGDRWPDYSSAPAYNPIDLQADQPIYAWSRSDSIVQAVQEAFPNRSSWFVDGPSITEWGFVLRNGPVPALGEPSPDDLRGRLATRELTVRTVEGETRFP